MMKDDHDQVALLLEFIKTVNPKFSIIGEAAWAIAASVDGSTVKKNGVTRSWIKFILYLKQDAPK